MDQLLSKFFDVFSPELLFAMTATSVIMFIATLIAIPWILVRLPEDYFDVRVPRTWMANHHPALRIIGIVVKNTLGVLFVLAGIAMLVLPGQGLLTMLLGVSLLDLPGKQRLEARIIGQPTVLGLINSMRERFGRKPLVIAPESRRQ